MKSVILSMLGGAVVSVMVCMVLFAIVPGAGTAGAFAILYALPGMIVGATIAILQYLKEMKKELTGEKKGED